MLAIDRSDLLSRFLGQTLKLTPANIAVGLMIYGIVLRFGIPWVALVFFAIPMNEPTPPALFGAFLEWPALGAYYLWSRIEIPKIFTLVVENGLLANNQDAEGYKAFLSEVENSFNAKRVIGISALLAIIASASVLLYFWPNDSLNWFEPEKHPWYACFEIVTYTLAEYIFFILVIREYLIWKWIGKLFEKFAIKVMLDFPDEAGGWGQIGYRAAGLSLFIVAMAVWALGFTITGGGVTTLPIVVRIGVPILFSLAAPLAFGFPIWKAHTAMKKYKHSVLTFISIEINELIEKSAGVWSDYKHNESAKLKQLENLRTWYTVIDSGMPEYPFSKKLASRIAPSWLLPFITGFIIPALEFLKTLVPGLAIP